MLFRSTDFNKPSMDTIVDSPARWDTNSLQENLYRRLMELTERSGLALTLKRIKFQIEKSETCQKIIQSWPEKKSSEKMDIWKTLIDHASEAIHDVIHICVQCGQCCRKSSPTLFSQDIPLVRSEKIPLHSLVTLRKGEPVSSPFRDEPFYLPEECIKVREKPHTRECIFLDSQTDYCTIYESRPYQCRVQSCWDESGIKLLTSQNAITRAELFNEVDTIIQVIEEHNSRCSFRKLQDVFSKLKKSEGQSIDEVLGLLSYEDHFRNFIGERLKLPSDSLDLFFGRSFSSLVRLFGFRIEDKADGTHILIADEETSQTVS